MRYAHLAAIVLLGLSGMSALAQSPGGFTSGLSTSTLPPSTMGENAATHDYLRAARASLVAGQAGNAQQSLEMAETRALDRSVPIGRTVRPSENAMVSRIREARRALDGGNTTHAIELIDLALAS